MADKQISNLLIPVQIWAPAPTQGEKKRMSANNEHYAISINTPDETLADYVYEDFAGNPVYFDGSEYWVIDRGEICNYG